MDTNAKLRTGKRGQKTEMTGRNPLRRQRSRLACSAIYEGGGGGGGGGEEGGGGGGGGEVIQLC
jgi:hypothetical protein